MSPEQNYPAVRFVVQYGFWLAVVAGLAPLFVAVVALLSGWGGGAALVLALSAPLLFLVMKAFAELVAIISDMLLPK
ncbi:hypothetical protein [Azospirillum brasilense]|uniref:DUF4282 domain-containing protein n=1 Tax=Azospirillum brasilense TaxID=192 RepID=A0A6L3AYP9_AZOBR|nr:hypothetical protein [Azospirillum brasilense]KAA0684442.1 hypothetical protein DS837_17670 [Azospirillum brasilense]